MSAHHSHHHHQPLPGDTSNSKNHFILTFSATLHCLLGCGLGEVLGMVIGTWLDMSNVSTMILAIILGFVFGFAFGMVPLLRAGFSFRRALKQVLIAEGLSIAVMEAVEVSVQVNMPGVMSAHLQDWVFWRGMLIGLAAGFVAAFPVNYYFIRRGIRHLHH